MQDMVPLRLRCNHIAMTKKYIEVRMADQKKERYEDSGAVPHPSLGRPRDGRGGD